MDARLAQALGQLTPEQVEALSGDISDTAGEYGLTLTPDVVERAAWAALSQGVHPSLSLAPQPAWMPAAELPAEPGYSEPEEYEPESEEAPMFYDESEETEPPDWSSMSARDQAAVMADRMRDLNEGGSDQTFSVGEDGRPASNADWAVYQAARVAGHEIEYEDNE